MGEVPYTPDIYLSVSPGNIIRPTQGQRKKNSNQGGQALFYVYLKVLRVPNYPTSTSISYHERTQIDCRVSIRERSLQVNLPKVRVVNCMEMPTDEATKSLYDDNATTDRCITLCDYRLIVINS